jgi:hypothetical protein
MRSRHRCYHARRDVTTDEAPDLSGRAPQKRRSPLRVWVLLALGLLALNYWIASRAVQPEARVHVPYSPFFLEQVRTGNVKSITSTGSAVQGTFERPVRYPPGPTGGRRRTSRLRFRSSLTRTGCHACSNRTEWSSTPSLSTRGLPGGKSSCSGSARHCSCSRSASGSCGEQPRLVGSPRSGAPAPVVTTPSGASASPSPTSPESTRRKRSSQRSWISSVTLRSTGG